MKASRWMSLLGVVSFGVIALLANVLAHRHDRRWDMTTSKLYTLSPATAQTLASLQETVRVDVLLPASDPLSASVRLMLEQYRLRTDHLDVVTTDPDRRPGEFLLLQQKYGIEAGRTEDGRVVVNAAIVVSRPGGKPFFVSGAELVDAGDDDGQGTRSRLEQALTLALRSVMSDERAEVCFIVGHGEVRLDDPGPRGLGELASRLRKNNYQPKPVDLSSASALSACRVVVIAAPSEPWPPADGARVGAFLQAGGNVLVLASPVPDVRSSGFLPLGLGAITTLGGISLDEDLVFEQDPSRRLPGGNGDQFMGEPQRHEITLGLVGLSSEDLPLVVSAARSLSRAGEGPVQPVELLTTSPLAFGMRDPAAWVKAGGAPARRPADRTGPLPIAMASELAPAAGAGKGQHGPRLVVVGTASVALGQCWQEHALRASALFTENALSWLAARPVLVDIPDKPAAPATRISEASLGEVGRYVLLYMPAAVALLGLSVFLRRRSTEGRPRAKE